MFKIVPQGLSNTIATPYNSFIKVKQAGIVAGDYKSFQKTVYYSQFIDNDAVHLWTLPIGSVLISSSISSDRDEQDIKDNIADVPQRFFLLNSFDSSNNFTNIFEEKEGGISKLAGETRTTYPDHAPITTVNVIDNDIVEGGQNIYLYVDIPFSTTAEKIVALNAVNKINLTISVYSKSDINP